MAELVLTRAEAAALCGLSVSGFDSWVRRGIVPGPIPGTKRWSRAALDRALSGAEAQPELDPFEQWKAEKRRQGTSAGTATRSATARPVVTPLPPAALGKREKSVLLQLYDRRGKKTRDADLANAGPATILKLGERGFLVPHGPYYFDLVLTDAGVAAAEELLAAERRT
ncbi:MAG: helix-turn-helix transcriptional regulator [Devosia sp.]